MTWTFKKKEEKHEHLQEESNKAAELIGRIRDDIKNTGGFALIGVSDAGEPMCLSAASVVSRMTKGQVLFSVAKSLGMNEINEQKMTKKNTEVAVAKEHTLAPKDQSAEALISQAISQNVPVETMERLLAMRRELKAERAKEEYDRAMAAFQADCPTIKKTREVKTDSVKVAYRYAPIESIVFQVKDALKTHGFSYTTGMELKEEGVLVTVKVTHQAGHSEVTPMEVPFGSKTNIMSQSQVAAAATTFAKRYAFCNAFGILTGDEDNDARPVEQAKVSPAQQKFETALRMVRESKNLDGLLQYQDNLKSSKTFNAKQKSELEAALKKRLAELEPQ